MGLAQGRRALLVAFGNHGDEVVDGRVVGAFGDGLQKRPVDVRLSLACRQTAHIDRRPGAVPDRLGESVHRLQDTRVVYLSDSPALAALEVLVNTRSEEDLQDYLILEVSFDEALVETYAPEDLPANWNQLKPPVSTQAIGDRWANEGRSPLLRVPSAVIPQQSNFLLNPLHPDMNKLEVGELAPFRFDPRLTQAQLG
jgi:RES domain-containing protein